MEKIYDLLKEISYLSFATVDEEGNPQSRTFGLIAIEDNKIYFNTTRDKRVYNQIINHPYVAINGCTKAGSSVRINGKIEVLDTDEARDKVLKAAPFLGEMYKDNLNVLVPLCIEHGTANIFDLSTTPPVIKNFTF